MRRLVFRSAATAAVVLVLGFLGSPAATAADPPQPPQQVTDYFKSGLIPRLKDLYGSGDGVTSGIDFDATTEVGGVSRVSEWTPDFLSGHSSNNNPTRLTNNWVASVSLKGKVSGLATVWINPATELPELASFDSPQLAIQLAAAPAQSLLVRDAAHEAWFAISGRSLVPLVAGTSGVTGTTTPDAYQLSLSSIIPAKSSGFSDIVVSALVLGVVILGLAVFVLLPVRKRSAKGEDDGDEEVAAEPAPDEQKDTVDS